MDLGYDAELFHKPSTAHPKQNPGPKRKTHLEIIEADDTLAMGDIVICENFFSFLRGEKTLFKQGGSGKNCILLPGVTGWLISNQPSLVPHVHALPSW